MNTLSDTKICKIHSSVMRQQLSIPRSSTWHLPCRRGGGNSLNYEREGMPGKCIRSVNCRLWFHLRCCGLKVSILPIKVFLKVLCTNNKLRLLCSVEDNIQYFNVFSTVWIKIICAGGCEFGQLVSLDGFPFAFRAKNGELRDLHLGFQVSFFSPWLQWQNVLIPLRLNLLNVYVYLHHWRSKFVYFVRPQGAEQNYKVTYHTITSLWVCLACQHLPLPIDPMLELEPKSRFNALSTNLWVTPLSPRVLGSYSDWSKHTDLFLGR